ncbi:MAG: molybdopterin-dependent oxidoreductase [Bacillus sp. (in: Bacteria)]|nr:molybdopterin-dependent oxidoreductase [Bacillus sp. (in: firmicutes)]
MRLHLYDLLQFPFRKIKSLLECAGNQRSKFKPQVYGEQWEDGAISQGIWEGVALRDLFSAIALSPSAQEIVFEGWDHGKDQSKGITTSFKRSLPLTKALHEDTIIALKYNNEPLTRKHGAPFRLIVPQWYGMASVKWLKSIVVTKDNFSGPYQTEDYMYYPQSDTKEGAFPVTTVNVNSIIQQPSNLSVLRLGRHTITGLAWTGSGTISKVQISFDEGKTWNNTNLSPITTTAKYCWTQWSYIWDVQQRGEYKIISKAIDTVGNIQPLEAFWNQKGYGYNACGELYVKVNS